MAQVRQQQIAPVVAVSLKTAAVAISVSPRTIARLVAERKLRTVRIGVRRLVPVTELTRFVEALPQE